MTEAKVLGYLGLAARGRMVESGEYAVEHAVRGGRACLVLIAGDASEATLKNYKGLCERNGVPWVVFSDRETLGRALGKAHRAAAALTDQHLAAAVTKVLNNAGSSS